jgi:hypothetical protein
MLKLAQGLADFHQSTTHQNFMTKFRETILTSKRKPSDHELPAYQGFADKL